MYVNYIKIYDNQPRSTTTVCIIFLCSVNKRTTSNEEVVDVDKPPHTTQTLIYSAKQSHLSHLITGIDQTRPCVCNLRTSNPMIFNSPSIIN